MRRFKVRLSDEAELDLDNIYRFVRWRSQSTDTARAYVARLQKFLADFETLPERGTLYNEIRPGLRRIGFEGRISVAFVVEDGEIIVLRLLYAGQQGGLGEG